MRICTQKLQDFCEFLSFVESVRGASKRLLENNETLESAFRMLGRSVDVFEKGLRLREQMPSTAISHHGRH